MIVVARIRINDEESFATWCGRVLAAAFLPPRESTTPDQFALEALVRGVRRARA
jgi:hypothetical protein